MLELAIQHGEEQKVDYNQIDMAIGAYHDIIETKLIVLLISFSVSLYLM